MDIMGPWLLATIKQDLDRIWGVADRQPHGSLAGAHGDDGSSVRVKASKPGIVQIIKVIHPSIFLHSYRGGRRGPLMKLHWLLRTTR